MSLFISIFSEEGDDWDVHIEDAILEKCKNINGILHIHVDKSSKEVN